MAVAARPSGWRRMSSFSISKIKMGKAVTAQAMPTPSTNCQVKALGPIQPELPSSAKISPCATDSDTTEKTSSTPKAMSVSASGRQRVARPRPQRWELPRLTPSSAAAGASHAAQRIPVINASKER